MTARRQDPGNAGEQRLARKGRTRGNTDRVADFLDPVKAARTRIETTLRYGGTPDPRDEQIVATAEQAER